jgi:hypothetical protein
MAASCMHNAASAAYLQAGLRVLRCVLPLLLLLA